MKANELRIGNLIEFDGRVVIADYNSIRIQTFADVELVSHIDNEKYTGYNPIPLTEEILTKAGFEVNYWESENREQKTMCLNGQSVEIWDDGRFYMSETELYIESVHQLQNLYFALACTELELKL